MKNINQISRLIKIGIFYFHAFNILVWTIVNLKFNKIISKNFHKHIEKA